jgi:hypothetical protein
LRDKPKQHAANDGGTAAAGARNHGQALHQANLQGVHECHGFNVVNARSSRILGLPALGPQNDEAPDDEGAGHHHGREQMGLDGLAKQQAQHHRRHEGNQHIQGKALRLLCQWASATRVSRIFCQ